MLLISKSGGVWEGDEYSLQLDGCDSRATRVGRNCYAAAKLGSTVKMAAKISTLPPYT
jgi:hypothetical protein